MTDDNLVFKALADPTRRRILDALRLGPQTINQLCEPFRLSRFAIMKHLAILAKAGCMVAPEIDAAVRAKYHMYFR